MTDFGDEFIIESFKVPWLIWIQLLVMILLIILLFFGFSVFTLEPSTSSAAAPPPPPPPHLNPSSSHSSAKVEIQRTRGDRVTNTEFTREEVQNGEDSSSKDSSFIRIFRNPNHPCNYFDLAKRAVLKCLGLDSSSELSDQHEKQE